MPQSRSSQVDISVTPYYHCISRCVRRAFLCGEDDYSGRNFDHRKQWLVERLHVLAEVFAIDICAFAVMSNHVHLVLRVDPERAKAWSDEDVAERYGRLFRLAKVRWEQLEPDAKVKQARLWRERLVDLSWMMRSLNEWIARQANKEDGCTGRFWEGRFKSQALLDERALLTCMAYVDLNPVRAGLAARLEEADFTSIQARLWQAAASKRGDERGPSRSPAGRGKTQGEKRAHHRHQLAAWALMPFVDQEQSVDQKPYAGQACIPVLFDDYVALVEWTGRAVRDKTTPTDRADTPNALSRFGLHPEAWLLAMGAHGLGRLTALGRAEALEDLAAHRGKRWVKGQRWARAIETRVA